MTKFATGARTLGTGFGIILRSPKLLLLGAVPALISTVLLLAALGTLVYFSGDLVSWMTPFADDWSGFWRDGLRIVVGVALVGGAALVGSLSFIALTLLIGGPFYEHIAEITEQRLGLADSGDGAGWFRLLVRGLGDALTLVLIALVGGLALLVLGFVPVAGQILAPILGALFGAWIISLEMVGLVFQRRGWSMAQRHRVLRGERATVFGFGLPTYLLCMVPVVQLVVIPAAVVGGTLLAHRLLGTTHPARATPVQSA